MRIKTNNGTIDPDVEMVLIVFNDDTERRWMIDLLSRMEPREGKRVFAIYPFDTPPSVVEKKAKEAICD